MAEIVVKRETSKPTHAEWIEKRTFSGAKAAATNKIKQSSRGSSRRFQYSGRWR
jgi:hypothetical protein